MPAEERDAQPGLLHALFAFLALPGTVAFLVPALLLNWANARVHLDALPVFGLGLLGLLWCVRDFYVAGKGTLAPWKPPRRLVTVGLYRYSRNPMYVAVLLILIGWALLFRARTLWIYAACVAVAFQLRVIIAEEPFLARTHGDAWTEYRQRVRRWI